VAEAELPDVQAKSTALLDELKDELVAAEDKAVDSFFLEIRAGTGGKRPPFSRVIFSICTSGIAKAKLAV